MNERRTAARQRTLIKGRIYFNNRLQSMECIVRDATANGARLEFTDSVTLPDAFELYIPARDEYFNVRVKWRRGSHLGVGWKSEEPAKDGTEPGADHPLAERMAKLEHAVAVLQRRLDALQKVRAPAAA
jgi:hypothetical protein